MVLSEISNFLVISYNKGYRVSDSGDIINPKGILLNGTICKKYKQIAIRYLGKRLNIPVHRLQAYQKYGDLIFQNGVEVRHKNGISTDNSRDNILIGTHQENMMDIPKEKRIINASNPLYNHNSILKDRLNGMFYKELMGKYNISSKGTISFIINKSLKSKN